MNYFSNPINVGAGMITKENSNPIASFRLLDLFIQQDFYDRGRWGVPQRDWRLPQGNDNDKWMGGLGDDLSMIPVNEVWIMKEGATTKVHWFLEHPFVNLIPTHKVEGIPRGDWLNPVAQIANSSKSLLEYAPSKNQEVPPIIFSLENIDEYNRLDFEISSYIAEQKTLFITGNRDLNEWGNYIETLKSMGLDRLLEIMQESYDKMNNK